MDVGLGVRTMMIILAPHTIQHTPLAEASTKTRCKGQGEWLDILPPFIGHPDLRGTTQILHVSKLLQNKRCFVWVLLCFCVPTCFGGGYSFPLSTLGIRDRPQWIYINNIYIVVYHFSCKRSLHPRSYVNRRHPKWDPLAFAASVWEVCLAAAHVKVNVTSLPCHGLSWFLHESSTELPLVGSVWVSKLSYTARVIYSTSQVVQVSITYDEGHIRSGDPALHL